MLLTQIDEGNARVCNHVKMNSFENMKINHQVGCGGGGGGCDDTSLLEILRGLVTTLSFTTDLFRSRKFLLGDCVQSAKTDDFL